ncbi:MAG: hypothetical protein Q4B85_11250 [Lachnospiraceae bacterium]|nr:hypothetical protein [Lachnospiraceae bacterium]
MEKAWKRRLILLVVVILCLATVSGITSGILRKGEQPVDFSSMKADQIESVELSGTTGGENGEISHCFTEEEKAEFLSLLNRVELGREVDSSEAASTGAAAAYDIKFKDGTVVSISPGKCFQVQTKYYKFKNFDDLWEEFIVFNSL